MTSHTVFKIWYSDIIIIILLNGYISHSIPLWENVSIYSYIEDPTSFTFEFFHVRWCLLWLLLICLAPAQVWQFYSESPRNFVMEMRIWTRVMSCSITIPPREVIPRYAVCTMICALCAANRKFVLGIWDILNLKHSDLRAHVKQNTDRLTKRHLAQLHFHFCINGYQNKSTSNKSHQSNVALQN